jgi:hypothetical protein
MIRRAAEIKDVDLREGRRITLTGHIAATIPAPGEDALWITVKVDGASQVEIHREGP